MPATLTQLATWVNWLKVSGYVQSVIGQGRQHGNPLTSSAHIRPSTTVYHRQRRSAFPRAGPLTPLIFGEQRQLVKRRRAQAVPGECCVVGHFGIRRASVGPVVLVCSGLTEFLAAVLLYEYGDPTERPPLYVSSFRILVRIAGEAGRVSRGEPALNAFQILYLTQ